MTVTTSPVILRNKRSPENSAVFKAAAGFKYVWSEDPVLHPPLVALQAHTHTCGRGPLLSLQAKVGFPRTHSLK